MNVFISSSKHAMVLALGAMIPGVIGVMIGGVLGFISGVVGIGGGIFLSPVFGTSSHRWQRCSDGKHDNPVASRSRQTSDDLCTLRYTTLSGQRS